MDIDYYNKLCALKDTGRFDMRLIIAPPRTGSTLIEAAVGKKICHEPFLRYGYSEADSNMSYKNIYDSLGGEDMERKSDNPATIIVKELAHRISPNNEFLRLVELSSFPPLFIIRNPLLTTESRLRKIVETIPQKYRYSTCEWLNSEINEGRSLTINEQTQQTQQMLLDKYGKKMGYKDWNDFATFCTSSQNYSLLEGILKSNSDRLAIDLEGNLSLESQILSLQKKGKKIMIIDSTEFRLDPEGIMRAVCDGWNYEYRDEMISWGDRKLELARGNEIISDNVWYDKLAHSREVKPPTEVPAMLSGFPAFLKDNLVQSGIPQYVRLFNNPYRIVGNKDKINRDLCSEVNCEGGSVTISDLDPVLGIILNPELRNDKDYLRKHAHHADVLEIVRRNLSTNEGDFFGRKR